MGYQPAQEEKMMKFASRTFIATALLALLAMPVRLAAQQQKTSHSHYRFVDVGTLGGPQSSVFGAAQVLNNHGALSFGGDTADSDPNYPNFNPLLGQDQFIQHAIKWHNGVTTDLGTLPGGWSSFSGWITDNGLIAGGAEDGSIDPVTGWPALHAVLWQKGKINDLGTLPGGYESGATAVSSAGQVVGFASNTITDPYSFFGFGTQTRGFLWTAKDGMNDIGDLGGPDTIAWYINDSGQMWERSNYLVLPTER
jgi:probable HAF family extracellular repeat protein